MTNETEPTVLQVNFGLKARHIIAVFTCIAGLIGTGGVAGWLFMPAKAVDLTALTAVVGTIEAKQTEHGVMVAKLTSQTAQLSEAVEGLRLSVDALPRRRADVAPDRPRKVAKMQRKRPVATAVAQGKVGLFGGL
jgi:hypothetical protein